MGFCGLLRHDHWWARPSTGGATRERRARPYLLGALGESFPERGVDPIVIDGSPADAREVDFACGRRGHRAVSTCAHATPYLLGGAQNAPRGGGHGAAALLWIYWQDGKHLLGTARPDNPYQTRIDTYADEAFAEGCAA